MKEERSKSERREKQEREDYVKCNKSRIKCLGQMGVRSHHTSLSYKQEICSFKRQWIEHFLPSTECLSLVNSYLILFHLSLLYLNLSINFFISLLLNCRILCLYHSSIVPFSVSFIPQLSHSLTLSFLNCHILCLCHSSILTVLMLYGYINVLYCVVCLY